MRREVDTLRRDARAIFQAGLKAVEPSAAVHRFVERQGDRLRVEETEYDLSEIERVFVLGAGKAGAAMARAVEERLADRIAEGWVNVKYGHTEPLQKVRLQEAGHPVPDAAGEKGATEILRLAESAGKRDLVICLISGGGSALLPLPAEGLTLADKQAVTEALLASGATIHEMNAVRKHLSRIKGGQLARAAFPARVLTLILSDVVGDDLDVIASGPTVPDASTFADAKEILARYGLWRKVPTAVQRHLRRGANGEIPETPKTGDAIFARTQNVIVANNLQAVQAAAARAKALGYNSLILSSRIEGETKDVAKVHAAMAKEMAATGHPVAPPACVVSGGETTVTLERAGKGGRNQEFVLAAALELAGWERVVILSAGTDGTDGPTDAAGAVCDGETVPRARSLGLDPKRHLAEHDAYPLFEALGDLIKTGPTNTNVMDLRLVLVG